jgi:hypothetical protein
MRDIIAILTLVAFAALIWLLGGCASSGLYTMSDEWCAVHAEAGPARCNRNPGKHYDVQGHMPPAVYGDLCPGRYEYGVYGTTITCWGVR